MAFFFLFFARMLAFAKEKRKNSEQRKWQKANRFKHLLSILVNFVCVFFGIIRNFIRHLEKDISTPSFLWLLLLWCLSSSQFYFFYCFLSVSRTCKWRFLYCSSLFQILFPLHLSLHRQSKWIICCFNHFFFVIFSFLLHRKKGKKKVEIKRMRIRRNNANKTFPT